MRIRPANDLSLLSMNARAAVAGGQDATTT
jgi:hypothetical protein